MNALQQAQRAMIDVEEIDRETNLPLVMAYAAIAQASALERIADALEIIAHPNRKVAPDPQDYYGEDEYNEAAKMYDYHKNSRRGESVGEYVARISAVFATMEPDALSPLDKF